ncbi:hypothetical protein J2W49_001702 [Hydrogenophaga palleronii]|uniref:Uncharacterized protein n=1 Tax=Hydrogenophaga palleronii TaxID=65655 RepID=A0ABU1WLE7_9BURK|nr:hypothetical protein [Hydrogenophaga palleronii]MDR7149747.1 hypothetical protein [Hydrogenophaga palleronii]
MSEAIDLIAASFAKTETGQQEIQKRSLGLAPLVRRLLVLVDGQRTGKDLAVFVAGNEVEPILQELVDKGCVEAKAAPAPVAPPPAAQEAPSANNGLAVLPDAATRSPAENDMARNFMVNTVNTIFGQHSRLTLIETISRSKTTDELRMAYLSWLQAMEGDRTGKKRLPDLQEKLFKVL